MRIHFMGIGGSGMSAVAQIAKSRGYQVTGCDQSADTPYIDKVKNAGIQVYSGHSPDHLKDIDLLCVTPAVFYQSGNHPEFTSAKSSLNVLSWQDFMGAYLHQNKFLICIAGTHGKSTTTALAGLLLESAGFDPTVEVGATVREWHNNVRIGQAKYFISEADEFYNNFRTYIPDILILTLVEYDHPEYFGTYEKMLDTYLDLAKRLKPGGTIIYNSDSPGCHRLIPKINSLKINLIPYSLSDFPHDLILPQPGNHSRLNAVAILKLSQVLKISQSKAYSVLNNFKGLSRRLELLGEKNGIRVFDDYANHPSSFAASIQAVKEKYPDQKILAVIEPHTFSRLKILSDQLPTALIAADEVIVSKIYASRETDPGNFTGQDIVTAIRHPNAKYIPEFSDIVSYIINHKSSFGIILVMGSGDSYKLSRRIFESL